MKEQEFLQQIRLDRVTLKAWIEEDWLIPAKTSGELDFTEIDLARARLIVELQTDMGVNDEGIGVILHLLDQLHGLRRAMKDLLGAAHAPGTPTRES
ncbi:MAG: chaperone modulator CbpM [Methylocystis sp.]|uniref:chaperone modulator CbpM n=1 Tax=Methylocystis sp. TaxID=1911079 RepID=UPI003DA391E3